MFANKVIHMMQRFTDDAQRVLSFAQEVTLELGHSLWEPSAYSSGS